MRCRATRWPPASTTAKARVRPWRRASSSPAAIRALGRLERDHGRPGTSTVVVSSTASRASLRLSSMKSGAAHSSNVRPSSPPSMQANAPRPSGSSISSTISPPGAIRHVGPPSPSAAQMWPSASSVQPSGAKPRLRQHLLDRAGRHARRDLPPRAAVGQRAVRRDRERGEARRRTSRPRSACRRRSPSPFGNHRSSPSTMHAAVRVDAHERRRRRVGQVHQVEAEVARRRRGLPRRRSGRSGARRSTRSGRRARSPCRPARAAAACGRASRRPASTRPAASPARTAGPRTSARPLPPRCPGRSRTVWR